MRRVQGGEIGICNYWECIMDVDGCLACNRGAQWKHARGERERGVLWHKYIYT